ncbi:ATP-dependent DNA ligase [Vibrio phage 11895-B1]|uniref:ATP-dependent DNA ligase n=1 Tax=Vibrio phage 11895-B1 TaxID=754075 RepID=UPI0002C119B4|nr:ATP-dependent DNA ligase [Vibrio phage 11895-B1]AGH32094.1 DNA ligase [Vibrio phage 11895-B1]
MIKIKETLYGEPKNGSAKQWSVYVDGCKVIVEWGRVGGKLQTKETTCTSKNVGKVNESTPEQQALLEAEAKWTKQYDNKLYRLTIKEAESVGKCLPMLAIDGSKKPEKIKYPCDIMPKLDGVRCMVFLEDGGVKAISRQGKSYPLHEELREELQFLLERNNYDRLDGELYIHGMKLQNIVSAVRSVDNPKHTDMQFHVFDVPSDESWSKRKQTMLMEDSEFVKWVVANQCENEDQLKQSVGQYMELGYEGTIVRNLKGKYEYNHRSNDLIKVKIMQDSEAKVVGCREDKNGEGVLTCEWQGVTFDVKMKGSHEERLFIEQEKLIGQWINFSFQALTEDGRPQFPVGNYVRECDDEGNPLE